MATTRPVAGGLFTEGADGPRLLAASCGACGKLHFPATETCPYCGERGTEPKEIGPDAILFLFTMIERAPPGYRGPVPYGFGVVELPEGLRVVTRLVGFDAWPPQGGLRVRLVLDPLFVADDGTRVVSYAFAPHTA